MCRRWISRARSCKYLMQRLLQSRAYLWRLLCEGAHLQPPTCCWGKCRSLDTYLSTDKLLAFEWHEVHQDAFSSPWATHTIGPHARHQMCPSPSHSYSFCCDICKWYPQHQHWLLQMWHCWCSRHILDQNAAPALLHWSSFTCSIFRARLWGMTTSQALRSWHIMQG